MATNQRQNATLAGKSPEDTYMEVWKIEQDHSRTRWTVATFFFSISFAIFGFSFTTETPAGSPINHIQRIAGLVLYWFSYALFYQFNRYTRYLRSCMMDMERKGEVSFTFQSDAAQRMYGRLRQYFTATWLLFYFGLLYLAAVVLLIALGVTLTKLP
jgi:hypothetical protein